MAWDSGVLQKQSLLRTVLREDPDTAIQAAAGLSGLQVVCAGGVEHVTPPSASDYKHRG